MAAPSLDEILGPIVTAAQSAFTSLKDGLWDTVKNVVINQMKQIAISIHDIGEGLVADPPYYTVEAGGTLVGMAINAAISTIAAATEMVITQVQAAVRQVLNAVRQQITTLVGAVIPAF
jgi:hypothetical protein